VYALAKSIILPPGSLILLLLLGLMWWRRPLLGRGLVFVSTMTLLLLSLPIVSGKLMQGLEPYPALANDRLATIDADAIVVLSGDRDSNAPEFGTGTIGALTLQRVRYASWLQQRTGLPLIVSGGRLPGDNTSVAELMRRVLEDELGAEVSVLEDRSRNTRENARFTAELLQPKGKQKILLVSHAWHLPRAVAAFEEAGIQVTPAPTAFVHRDDDILLASDFFLSANAFRTSYFAIHEYLGQIWYSLRRKLDI